MSEDGSDKNSDVERALRHSIRDGIATSVAAGGGETYFSAFALFVGAGAPQVALLTTLPALLGSLVQFLSAWLGRFFGRRRIILVGAALQAVLWLPILGAPLLLPDYAVGFLLVLFALYYGAANLAAPQWTSLMRDLVPERRRGRYFGRRTRFTTISSFTALVLSGVVLHAFASAGQTALGFAVVFVASFLARAVSVYHLGFLHEPESPPPGPDMNIRHWWTSLCETGAVKFSAYFILMNLAVGISAPFFAVYMLRDLQFSYLQFAATTGTSILVQFLTLHTWGRIADVYGNRPILLATSATLPIVPMLWLISAEFWYLLVVQCVSGLSWAGFNLSAGNLLYDLVPRSRRAAYLAFHNVGTATGVFVGAMLGAASVELLPAREPMFGAVVTASNLLLLFLLSGVARAAVAVVLARRVSEIRKPRRSLSTPALVMRITGFNAMLGLIYELIGRNPAAPDNDADLPRSNR